MAGRIIFWFHKQKPALQFTTHIYSAASAQSGNWFSVSLMSEIAVKLMHTMWRVYPTLPHCLMNYIDIIWIGNKKANQIIAVGFLKPLGCTYVEVWGFSASKICHNWKGSCCSRTEVRRVVRWSLAALRPVTWKVSFFFFNGSSGPDCNQDAHVLFPWVNHYSRGPRVKGDSWSHAAPTPHRAISPRLHSLSVWRWCHHTSCWSAETHSDEWSQLSAGWLCMCLCACWFCLREL